MTGTAISSFPTNRLASSATADILDNILFTWGNGRDIASLNRTATLTANTALTDVLIGTPVTPALAANSFILANQTANGDVMIAANDGGTSYAGFFMDGSEGTTDIRAKGAINFMASSDVDDYLTITAVSNVVTLTATGSSFNFVGAAEFDGITLGGAVSGGDQAFTGVGDMTFTDGSIIAAIDGAATTLLVKAGGLSGTTFITLNSASGGTDSMVLGKTFFYDVGGEYIESNGTTLTIAGAVSFSGSSIVTADSATIEIGAAGVIKSGATNTDTLLLAANDTTFITFTTAATDVCTANNITMSGTWLASGTVTLPSFTTGTITATSITRAGANVSIDPVINYECQINTSGNGGGLLIVRANDGAYGPQIMLRHNSASVAVGDFASTVYQFYDGDAAYMDYATQLVYPSNIGSGTEEATMKWNMAAAGANNEAMILVGTGLLSVDLSGSGGAAQVDLFDDYDDALILRQGIQQHNRELLADIGILDRKDTGSGYMMKIQPMVRLLAGGIYQTRQMLEDKVAYLEGKIDRLELTQGRN